MNPLRWQPKHIVALVLSAIIGGVIGLLGGYVLDSMSSNKGIFFHWLQYPLENGVASWFLFGAALGAGVTYVYRLNSD